MKKFSLALDDTLIISRLQQKELAQLKPGSGRISHTLAPMEKFTLDPFLHNLPLKIGLSFNLLGSKILSTHVERGFLYHGLENRLATLGYPDSLTAMARLNHKTPIFYQLALTRALEELLEERVAPTTLWMRALALEYARAFHHAHVVGQVLLCLELDALHDLSSTAYSLMKPAAGLLAQVHNEPCPTQLSSEDFNNLLEALDNVVGELDAAISFDNHVRQTLRKRAVITLNMAASFGLTGLYLRSNRSTADLRSAFTHRPRIDIAEGGDAYARFTLRVREIKSCIEWLRRALATGIEEGMQLMPLLEPRDLPLSKAVHPFAFGEVAGPEGDIKMSIFIDKESKEPIFRLRSPAYFITQALPHLLAQADLHDLPWVLHSLGISAEEIDK